ncbi:MAG: winged helix-turn-helix domain-containing protein [Polyangiaceae bacterium]
MTHSVLIVDNDSCFTSNLSARLPGVRIERSSSLDEGMEEQYALVLVALEPDTTQGLRAIAQARSSQEYYCSILAYANGELGVSAVLAYQAGADDCFSISAEITVVEAKVRSALARVERCTAYHGRGRLFDVMDRELTRFEQRLLRVLTSHSGTIVPMETIVREIWGRKQADAKLIYEHISTLRSKLRQVGWTIANVRGQGYRLEAAMDRSFRAGIASRPTAEARGMTL